MEYTLIGGPLFGDDGYYYSEITIKRLLRDKRNGWTLEIPGFAEEHLCTPFYDNGSFNRFDDLITIQKQTYLFDMDRWGTLLLTYEGEEESVLQWFKWVKCTPSVSFVFRKREENVIKRLWIFQGVESCDIDYDSLYGVDEVALEFNFTRFENVDLQSQHLKYNGDG